MATHTVTNRSDSGTNFWQEAISFTNADLGENTIGEDTKIGLLNPVSLTEIEGSNASELLIGNGDRNILYGYQGNDTLIGAYDDDWLNGGANEDELLGNQGNDTLIGGAGNDILKGAIGDDWLNGGMGADYLFGHLGNDTLQGGMDTDILHGGSGDDFISANEGNDFLSGGDGNDILIGGGGRDILKGGAGNDVFVIQDVAEGEHDVIKDFELGVDRLNLSQFSHEDINVVGTPKNSYIYSGDKLLAIVKDVSVIDFAADQFPVL